MTIFFLFCFVFVLYRAVTSIFFCFNFVNKMAIKNIISIYTRTKIGRVISHAIKHSQFTRSSILEMAILIVFSLLGAFFRKEKTKEACRERLLKQNRRETIDGGKQKNVVNLFRLKETIAVSSNTFVPGTFE